MFTRLIQKRRPRKSAVFAIGTGVLVAIGLAAAVAFAVTQFDTGTGAGFTGNCDVTVPANTSSADCQLGPAGAEVSYIGSSDTVRQSSGTGLFDPFVRIQGSPTEKGYNTNGTVAFDTKTGTWTHAIKANAIPLVSCNRFTGDTATCWELFNDINENNTAKRVSLNVVEVWFTTNPNLVGYLDPSGGPSGFPSGATKVYDFHGNILINDVNSGSGRGDLRYLIPLTNIDSFNSSTYFVLFSKWGTTPASTTANAGTGPWTSDGGFEEWKVRKVPNVHIVKTANPVGPVNAGTDIGFDITVTNTGAADATNVTITDNPLPAGGDLNWSLNPAFPGCSITGPVGSQVLNCSFATLAATTGSIGPIHIQSHTTAADCAVVSNTATVAASNDGSDSSTATVTVQCGALLIKKESTKTGNPLVANAGAVFSVDGPDAGTTPDFSVTDDLTAAAPDEDALAGEVCVSGLAPGAYTINETTAPPGYGSASQTNVALTVANGTNCTDSTKLPGAGATATFTNPPLGEIGVTFKDLGSGETNASIVCKTGTTTVDAVSENNTPDPAFDDTNETFTRLPPGQYDCTVVIDP